MIALPDHTEHLTLEGVPRKELEQWYMFQLHVLGVLVRRSGGTVVIGKCDVEDINRQQRLWTYEDVGTGNLVLQVRDMK